MENSNPSKILDSSGLELDITPSPPTIVLKPSSFNYPYLEPKKENIDNVFEAPTQLFSSKKSESLVKNGANEDNQKTSKPCITVSCEWSSHKIDYGTRIIQEPANLNNISSANSEEKYLEIKRSHSYSSYIHVNDGKALTKSLRTTSIGYGEGGLYPSKRFTHNFSNSDYTANSKSNPCVSYTMKRELESSSSDGLYTMGQYEKHSFKFELNQSKLQKIKSDDINNYNHDDIDFKSR